MKRVICINAEPIDDYGNLDLHLLKEGKVYKVEGIHPITGGYNIGVRPNYCEKNDITCYWGPDRFLECEEGFSKKDDYDSD